jgi:hypothetical protein
MADCDRVKEGLGAYCATHAHGLRRLARDLSTIRMQRAVDHADRVSDKWSDRAFDLLMDFIRSLPDGAKFMTEDFRRFAYGKGLAVPPSERAFGSIISRAAKTALIFSNGTAKVSNPKAHQANAAVWRKGHHRTPA